MKHNGRVGQHKLGKLNNRTEMMKIELINTQSNRLIRTAACSAAHKSKRERVTRTELE